MNNQKGFANIILVIVIVVLVGAVGYFAFVKKSEPIVQQPTPTHTQKVQTPAPTPTTSKTTGLKTYTNTKYSYQISYDSKVYTINAFSPAPKESPTSDNVLFFKTSDLNSPEPLATVAINAYSNPQELSPENYLKQNYQKWLGTPSNYSDFYMNEATTFNGMTARKFGTERDQYILITKGKYAFTISTGDLELIKTFTFTN